MAVELKTAARIGDYEDARVGLRDGVEKGERHREAKPDGWSEWREVCVATQVWNEVAWII